MASITRVGELSREDARSARLWSAVGHNQSTMTAMGLQSAHTDKARILAARRPLKPSDRGGAILMEVPMLVAEGRLVQNIDCNKRGMALPIVASPEGNPWAEKKCSQHTHMQ
eukprot:956174-Amphidinium_carterae.1